MALRHRKSFNEINITPLTDIFLVLLIIMMVIAPLLDQQGLKLIVPDNVQEEQMNKELKVLNVLVTNDDEIIIDDEIISKDRLQYAIVEKIKDYKDGVMIQAEEDATHGAVVRVMDCARNAGVVNVSVTEF